MNLKEFASYDATGLAELVKKGEVTPDELVALAIEGIKEVNPDINSVWQVLEDEAYAEIKKGLPEGPFEGVPFLIKEMVLHATGVETNFGSRLAEGVKFPIDSWLMEKFREAGFVLIGTTSTPEWAFNATTEPVLKGPTHTPHKLGHSSGGSSGGAAASVAAGIVPIAHGNDGGGSIRIPAANSGVVGLKPTRGRVSAAPYHSEPLSGHGIEFALTKSIRDTATLLDVISNEQVPGEYSYAPKLEGFDSYSECIKTPVRKLRIAYSTETSTGFEPTQEVKDALLRTVEKLRELGHEVVEDAPVYDKENFIPATAILWTVSVTGMIEAVRGMTGREPSLENTEAVNFDAYKKGMEIKAHDFAHALEQLAMISRQVCSFFDNYDVFLTPTMSSTPTPFGVLDANAPDVPVEDLTRRMLGEVAPYTALFNTTGQPAISLPLEQNEEKLPIGMQFVGKFGDEGTILQLGAQLEKEYDWNKRIPVVHVSRKDA